MFDRVLIANRGEIARRIIRTSHLLGLTTVSLYSDADADLPHVNEATHAVNVGPGPASESYLNIARVLQAARDTKAQAVHPGYGFLSENPDFAEAVQRAGLVWIGPSPETMRLVADKARARFFMGELGVPVNAGSAVNDIDDARRVAQDVGFPLMVKSCSGGGGIGMEVVHSMSDLPTAVERCQSFGARFFGSSDVLVERYMADAKHVEVQIMGYKDGHVDVLGERECSVQRRFQKVLEEAPSPALRQDVRDRLVKAALAGAEGIGYLGAGTFEFLVSDDAIAFLEVNARIQVEHPITEMTTGYDIVAKQLHIASEGKVVDVPRTTDAVYNHALEMRLYAEDPVRFFPSPGPLDVFALPDGEGIRVETGYRQGNTVSRHYDPLLAKICVGASSRPESIKLAMKALSDVNVQGVKTNKEFLLEVLKDTDFISGKYDVRIAARLRSSVTQVESPVVSSVVGGEGKCEITS